MPRRSGADAQVLTRRGIESQRAELKNPIGVTQRFHDARILGPRVFFFRRRPSLCEREQELLTTACARNQAIDLHYKHDGQPKIAHARLIEYTDEELRIDRPSTDGREALLTEQQEITAFFADDSRFYSFATRILQTRVRMELNRDKRILGVTLETPTQIIEEQRRHAYRLSLAKYEVKVFLSDGSVGADTLQDDPKRLTGRIVNLSVGGMAVLVPIKGVPPLRSGELFAATFSLPNQDDPLYYIAELRHVRRVRDGLNGLAGFRFTSQGPRDVVRQSQRIHQFIIGEQRRHLRRRVR